MVATKPQLYTSSTPEWYTPPELVRDVVGFLGGIDLDPAARSSQHIPAARHEVVDGLAIPWAGKVYCNPPYGREIGKWTAKGLSDPAVHELIMLVPARTDTRWFQPWYRHTVLFIAGRLAFHRGGLTVAPKEPWQERLDPLRSLTHPHVDDRPATEVAPFPSALLYRGPFPVAFAHYFNHWGTCFYPGGSLIRGRLA